MLESIANFFETIGTVITTLVSFVISIVGDIVFVVQLTGMFVLNIPSYFSWLPLECVAILTIIFAIVVTYKILGREG